MKRSLVFLVVFSAAATLLAGIPEGGLSAEAPQELKRWSFLVGEWDLAARRYSLDGPVIEENHGTASFTLALEGLRIQEQQTVTFAGQSMTVLNLFAFHPEQQHWEVARTDSLHTNFNVLRGTATDDGTLVLFERDPQPDSNVSRRFTYSRLGNDSFSLLLEFSLDRGETWLRRNETVYTRR